MLLFVSKYIQICFIMTNGFISLVNWYIFSHWYNVVANKIYTTTVDDIWLTGTDVVWTTRDKHRGLETIHGVQWIWRCLSSNTGTCTARPMLLSPCTEVNKWKIRVFHQYFMQHLYVWYLFSMKKITFTGNYLFGGCFFLILMYFVF